MNSKTAKLIRAVYPVRREYQLAKREWNRWPKNQRAAARANLKDLK